MQPAHWAALDPHRPAVVMGGGEIVTYRELDERAGRFQQLLTSYGLQPGDVVAIFSENSARYHELTWACRRGGYYFATVNSHLGADEVAYIVNDCGAKVLVAGAGRAPVAAQLTPERIPTVTRRLAVGGRIDGYDDYDLATAAFSGPVPEWTGTQGELLQYSSGTTGRPKGIKRTLRPTPAPPEENVIVPFLQAIGLPEQGRYLSPAPLYHSAPISWSMGVHVLGGTVYVMERFDPQQALRLIEEYRITHGQFVPTMFVRMLKLPDEVRLRYDVSSLQTVVHAAAPCPIEVKRAMIAWWGPIVSEYWSSSEGAGTTFITAPEWLEHPGSVGRGFHVTLHICDEQGNELAAGQEGQIWAEGAPEFSYLNDPDKTAEAHDARGWCSVGDVGRLAEDGYLYLTDRKAFMIISGGVNIYPQEAENVLIEHPAVLDVAVLGVPNDDLGEEVRGVVQPVRWEDAGPQLAAELIAYCQQRLSAYKCPRQIDFERELPRLDTGKLYKRKLKERYEAAHRAARA
jgi:acyl-CoA synthetase (AMP-forming)/AMP-acid ligase II